MISFFSNYCFNFFELFPGKFPSLVCVPLTCCLACLCFCFCTVCSVVAESTNSELDISNGGRSCSKNVRDWGYRNTLLTPARLITDENTVVMRIDATDGEFGPWFGWAPSTLRMTGTEFASQGFYLWSGNGTKYAEGGISDVKCGLSGFDKVGTVIRMVYRPSAGEILFGIDDGDLTLVYSGVSGKLRPAILFRGVCNTVSVVDH